MLILIETITDNKNRTLNEIKHILNEYEAKIGAPGSALWAFEKKEMWAPKHIILIEKPEDKKNYES